MSSADFFKIIFFQYFRSITCIRVPNGLDQDQGRHSGSNLFATSISRRHKSLLARKNVLCTECYMHFEVSVIKSMDPSEYTRDSDLKLEKALAPFSVSVERPVSLTQATELSGPQWALELGYSTAQAGSDSLTLRSSLTTICKNLKTLFERPSQRAFCDTTSTYLFLINDYLSISTTRENGLS